MAHKKTANTGGLLCFEYHSDGFQTHRYNENRYKINQL